MIFQQMARAFVINPSRGYDVFEYLYTKMMFYSFAIKVTRVMDSMEVMSIFQLEFEEMKECCVDTGSSLLEISACVAHRTLTIFSLCV